MNNCEVNEFTKADCSFLSDDCRLLIKALATAKREFRATGKSGKTKQWDYAQLEDIYNAVEEALFKHEIGIEQQCYLQSEKKEEILITRLVHWPSGQWKQDLRYIVSEKPGSQGRGGAETYCRRYALLTICGIPQACDDGREEQKYIETKKASVVLISQQQKDELKTLIVSGQLWHNIKADFGIQALEQLPANKFESLKQYIENHKSN